MSGFNISISLNDVEVRRGIGGLLTAAEDLTPLLDEIGSYVENTTKLRFSDGVGPDGKAWTPSRRAAREGGQTLLNHGHLRDSITYVIQGDEVMIGTNVIYAAIHQFGGVIRPKSAKKLAFRTPDGLRLVDQVTIPARPYLGVNDEDKQEIRYIFKDIFEAAVRRGGDAI